MNRKKNKKYITACVSFDAWDLLSKNSGAERGDGISATTGCALEDFLAIVRDPSVAESITRAWRRKT
jgi:hypothetical protein